MSSRCEERRCNEHGFSSERTGQFGIGVLSYFMLADRLELRIERVPAAGSEPESIVHVYGVVPPVATTVSL